MITIAVIMFLSGYQNIDLEQQINITELPYSKGIRAVINSNYRTSILVISFIGILFVPLQKVLTNLPPVSQLSSLN